MIRAKFNCDSIVKDVYGNENVLLSAVTADGGECNKAWSEATPVGKLTLSISNPAAQGKFESGKEYFVDVSEVISQG